MRLHTLDEAEEVPVSHNRELRKKVIVPEGVGCVRHISRIVLKEGSTAAPHAHADATEVFYCVGGEVCFIVGGQALTLRAGSCLVVDPGDAHGITGSTEGAEMLYMMVAG